MNRAALIILDGWGINPNPIVSAIAAAKTPVVDGLLEKYPSSTLVTYGEQVGLPEGQMGNSEVGHINIGAGRIVYQELARINKAIRERDLLKNSVFTDGLAYARTHNRKIHIMGLVSDGGVHSHIDHLIGLCELLRDENDIDVFIHAFLDGRDTDPHAGKQYINLIQEAFKDTNIHLADAVGRYYAMDRDKRWERVKVAYDLLTTGIGKPYDNLMDGIQKSYDDGVTDEFLLPIYNSNIEKKDRLISEDDVVIFFNFRTDRPRQLTEALTQRDFPDQDMHPLNLHYITFSNYDKTFKNIKVIFEKENVNHTLGQIISEAGGSQVRIAETEKYPHVTFFFNGGKEDKFEGEDRILIPSPKVATYDLKPEMSAIEITDSLIEYVEDKKPDFICLNYANTDMVGHTGVFSAAVKAAETVDTCLGRLLEVLFKYDYQAVIIADHGNSDIMVNPDGSPNTAHTTNPVHVILAGNDINKDNYSVEHGKLGDIAPGILTLMGLEIHKDMTGDVIFDKINK